MDTLTFRPFVPLFVTAKAGKLSTVSAFDFLWFLVGTSYLLLAFKVWAPKHIWIFIYFPGKLKTLVFLEILIFEDTLNFLFFQWFSTADTCHLVVTFSLDVQLTGDMAIEACFTAACTVYICALLAWEFFFKKFHATYCAFESFDMHRFILLAEQT